MNTRALIWIGIFVCSTIGGALPLLWGGSMLSMAGLLWSTIGAFVGIWVGYKLSSSV